MLSLGNDDSSDPLDFPEELEGSMSCEAVEREEEGGLDLAESKGPDNVGEVHDRDRMLCYQFMDVQVGL